MRSISKICLAFICLASFLACGVRASGEQNNVTVSVDRKPVEGEYTWKNVNGQVVGPIEPIIQAMGGNAQLEEDTAHLSIRTANPWRYLDNVATGWFKIGAFDFYAVGPLITVRHLLSEQQMDSMLTQQEGGEANQSILVRFEVISAEPRFGPGGYNLKPETGGFEVKAILYWVTFDAKRQLPNGSTGAIDFIGPKGPEGASRYSPIALKVRIDTMRYTVIPKDATFFTPMDYHYPGKNKDVKLQGIVWGKTGWEVKNTRIEESKSYDLTGKDNTLVPVYDLSVRYFDGKK